MKRIVFYLIGVLLLSLDAFGVTIEEGDFSIKFESIYKWDNSQNRYFFITGHLPDKTKIKIHGSLYHMAVFCSMHAPGTSLGHNNFLLKNIKNSEDFALFEKLYTEEFTKYFKELKTPGTQEFYYRNATEYVDNAIDRYKILKGLK